MVDELESSIEQKLDTLGLSKDKINAHIAGDGKKSYAKEINSLKKKVDKNNLQISNLTDKLALMSNETSMILINRIEQLAEDNKRIQSELIGLENLEIKNTEADSDLDALYSNIQLFNQMKDATLEDKRKLARLIIEKIDFDKEDNIANITLRT